MLINEIKVTPYTYKLSSPTGAVPTQFEAEFEAKDGSEVVVELYVMSNKSGILAFDRDGDVEMTHKGDQFKILFTIMEIITKMLTTALAKEMLTELTFSADSNEPSRVKLYTNKLSPEISKILGPNWEGPKLGNDDHSVTYTWNMKNDEH